MKYRLMNVHNLSFSPFSPFLKLFKQCIPGLKLLETFHVTGRFVPQGLFPISYLACSHEILVQQLFFMIIIPLQI